VTLADVAEAVGLSPAAVSLALRGKDGVSEATRARIVEAARTLGYRPAAGVASQYQKPMTIGLIIKAVQGDAPDSNRFYGPVMAGIEEACRTHRIDLMLATMPVDQHYYPIEIPRIASDRTCDGIIVVGAHLSQATSEILRGAPPCVLIDSYTEDDRFDSVAADNVGGARTAVRHLVELGHHDIAILASEPHAFPSILQRRRGYEQVLAEAGLTPRYIDVPHWPPDSAAIVGINFLKAHPDISAVFCANDAVAVALLQAARQACIEIPGQFSVVGFDDIDLAAFVSPALTTMSVDKVGMGRIAVTLLAHRLELGKECVTQTLVRPTLVERESTCAVSSAARSVEAAAASRVDPLPA
jgi:DNA-binding LacI/PurR family transcriptional regulator